MEDHKTRGMKSWGLWYKPEEQQLMDLIDDHRKVKGMTRKAFILYAIANMIPDLAEPIVEHLLARPKTKDAQAIHRTAEEADTKQ